VAVKNQKAFLHLLEDLAHSSNHVLFLQALWHNEDGNNDHLSTTGVAVMMASYRGLVTQNGKANITA